GGGGDPRRGPPNRPGPTPSPASRTWSATTSPPSCGTPTGSSPAPAAPPRSSASTPAPCAAASRSSAFRDPLANSGDRSRNVARPFVGRLGTASRSAYAATEYVSGTTDKSQGRRARRHADRFCLPRRYEEAGSVLRITRISQKGRGLTIKLEGDLAGAWVGTVRDACAVRGRRPRRLDLAARTYVDAS